MGNVKQNLAARILIRIWAVGLIGFPVWLLIPDIGTGHRARPSRPKAEQNLREIGLAIVNYAAYRGPGAVDQARRVGLRPGRPTAATKHGRRRATGRDGRRLRPQARPEHARRGAAETDRPLRGVP